MFHGEFWDSHIFRCEIHVLVLLLLHYAINASFRVRGYSHMWVDKGSGGKQRKTF